MGITGDFQKESKYHDQRGRCLHYENGECCDEIISAHSIQNKGQLSLIAENGHVYCLSSDMSTLNKNDGKPQLKKTGVNRASTFYGFCKLHDNQLFEPIDNFPMGEDKKQIALYAYRCVCRELFVKENAVSVLKYAKDHSGITPEMRSFISGTLLGNNIGLSGLNYHKNIYDQALINEYYDDFEFVFFNSTSQCNVQLSGLLYPDFDFEGHFLQEIGRTDLPLDLITFFTAPVENGWAFCLAWHASSNNTCMPLVRSLANKVYNGEKIEDAMLRLSLYCCENHAIRISWWDNLNVDDKNSCLEAMQLMADPINPIPSDYLVSGCEGIADWSFDYVHQSW